MNAFRILMPTTTLGLTRILRKRAHMLVPMADEPKDEEDREELIPAPPFDAERKERLAAIRRGEKPGKQGEKGVSEQRKQSTPREKAERASLKKSLRGPRKRG
ncbi:MAG TPA: hypothetical protein VD790_12125 [Thermoleophilaceae bacterium]|nr:hypothetical protein [Thermoleophilaceae bacterium]